MNQSFIEISPTKDKKCCYNCKHFGLWGVHTGFCRKKGVEKMDNQTCRKDYESKTT